MRRRALWLIMGWAAGLSSSVWVQRRLRRAVVRYTPEHLRNDLTARGSDLANRVRRFSSELNEASQASRHDHRASSASQHRPRSRQ